MIIKCPDCCSFVMLKKLAKMGNLLFRDSRQRNAIESKQIDAFFKSKTKVISLRKL